MNQHARETAKREIDESLRLSTFCMRRIGISFDKPKCVSSYLRQKLMFATSVLAICYHVFSEIVYIGLTFTNSPRVEDVVPLFHTFGYGALSIAKVFVLWYKINVFGQLLEELSVIWPMPPLNEDAQGIKNKSLAALRIGHQWYFAVNILGVWFYNVTPILIYLYRTWQGLDAQIGFVWVSWYPFDKHEPIAHIAVYIFEIFAGTCHNHLFPLVPRPTKSMDYNFFAFFLFLINLAYIPNGLSVLHALGMLKYNVNKSPVILTKRCLLCQTCVWIMVSTDLLFSGMASHIGLLLRILKRRLESLATTEKSDDEYYEDIIENIKLHQRLISYCKDLEEAFSLVNLINIVLSSVNICCVLFVIVLLEPLMALSNKLFLMSALIQIGTLCWYADDILHANADIATAAYNSGWYRTSPRCRQALLFLIKRSQKTIAFTAMNFTNISLVTYSAILTRSYSYFALLYTMYNEN